MVLCRESTADGYLENKKKGQKKLNTKLMLYSPISQKKFVASAGKSVFKRILATYFYMYTGQFLWTETHKKALINY